MSHPLLPPTGYCTVIIASLLEGAISYREAQVLLIQLFFLTLKVSGYPGSHGIPAMAGSIYPGQASLLDQADSWNHRPQEISVWQPNMEV